MSVNLRIGQRFDITGFERVAVIDGVNRGRILVMHNNSSHIHVASQWHDDAIDNYQWAVLEASFPYYMQEGDYAVAYRYALKLAMELAVKR